MLNVHSLIKIVVASIVHRFQRFFNQPNEMPSEKNIKNKMQKHPQETVVFDGGFPEIRSSTDVRRCEQVLRC